MLRSQSPLSFCLTTRDMHCLWYGEGFGAAEFLQCLQCLRCLLSLEDSPGFIFSLGNAGMVWREPPLIFDLFLGRGDGHRPLVYRRGCCFVSMSCLTATNAERSLEYCIFFSDYNRCIFAGAILALLVACEKCGPFGRVSCGVGVGTGFALSLSSLSFFVCLCCFCLRRRVLDAERCVGDKSYDLESADEQRVVGGASSAHGCIPCRPGWPRPAGTPRRCSAPRRPGPPRAPCPAA